MIYWVKETVHILRLYGDKSIKCSLFRLNSVKNFTFVLQTSIGNETAIKHICEARPFLAVQGLVFTLWKANQFCVYRF